MPPLRCACVWQMQHCNEIHRLVLFPIFYRVLAIDIIEKLCVAVGNYDAFGRTFHEPIVIYLAGFLGYARYGHRGRGGVEGIVVYGNVRAGDIRAVFAGTSTVHVKTMAERIFQDDIVSGNVTASGPSCASDGMAVPVKQVVFDDG